MKTFVFLPVLFLLSGCMGRNLTTLARQLKDDKATVVLGVNTVYGNLRMVRIMPGTNTIITASPDGTVTVKRTE